MRRALAAIASVAVGVTIAAAVLLPWSPPATPYTGPAIMVGHPGFNVPHQSPPPDPAHVVGDPGAVAPWEARP